MIISDISTFKNNNLTYLNFSGKIPSSPRVLTKIHVKTLKEREPVNVFGLSFNLADYLIKLANERGISIDDAAKLFIKPDVYIPKVAPIAPKTIKIGNNKITVLTDGKQILEGYHKVLKSAKKIYQSSMFEFQNLKVDKHWHPSCGAEVVPGFKEQQEVLGIMVDKKRKDKNFQIQQILDTHKWYTKGFGEKARHYNNQDMIRYMKTNGIDVVPSPRQNQGGSVIDHWKLAVADGKTAIVTGMNLGSHSAANHDFGILIETITETKPSAVDNLVEAFNTYYTFAWHKLGSTPLIKGPLTEAEQKLYNGLDKEIKPENVEYMKIVGELFDNPTDRNRYKEGRLILPTCKPIDDPLIKVLKNSPQELEEIGAKGEETIFKEMIHKLKTCSKYRGLNFVFSNKEAVEIIIDRFKKGELDVKLILESSLIKKFPYLRKSYNMLKRAGVPIIRFNVDKETNQMLHAKLQIFDDKTIIIGSPNMSGIALNQNLDIGSRNDYPLHTKRVNKEIKTLLKDVKYHENLLNITPFGNEEFDYEKLKTRKQLIRKITKKLKKEPDKTLKVTISDKEHTFTSADDATLSTIFGYYQIIQKRHKAKVHYKRGNNELAVALESPTLAKHLMKQFERDERHSKTNYDEIRHKAFPKPVMTDNGLAFIPVKANEISDKKGNQK